MLTRERMADKREEQMKHFDIIQWSDFVRGAGDANARRAMRAHLDQDCKRCACLVRRLSRIVAVAERDAAQRPPDDLLRSIKSSFDSYPSPPVPAS